MMRGPSPYAVRVLKSILRKGRTVPQIETDTGLARRTVLAQINALKRAEAAAVVDRLHTKGEKAKWAVYRAVVVAI